ncbi:MAG: hypothetical protein ACD_12C00405G0005 [uncultured bacterium]|nr:MAG: hypothetical protein ACD_12C00405G0005 [uncultured bacterium]
MNISALQTFYIVGAIVLLAIAIVAYPTLRDKNR